MRRILLATTALAPLAFATSAIADTTIGTSTTSNVATATVNGGAADNIIVSSTGSIAPAGGTAITINSSNTVSNAGSITFTDISSVRGIAGTGGFASGITNSGTISATESYTQTDTNGDGVVDGAFAQGTDRYGILVNGAGTFTGNVGNVGGTITVKGNNSAGISVSTPIGGTFTNTGTITVTGNNNYGVYLGAVTGAVAIGGTNTVTGANSVGYALTGDVGGSVVVHGTVTTTGYTATTLPTALTSLTSDNLLQGGSALAVSGNVAGGIRVGASLTTTTDTTADTDADGQPDVGQGAGTLTTYGAAPALIVGSATNPIALGPIANGTYGIEIDGTVLGSGVYAGVNATGMQLGGLGGTVTVSGGADVTGAVRATANGGNAVGILIGSGANVASLTNSGGISGASTTTAGGSAQGITIAAGATLPAITNSGTISATVTVGSGTAAAIADASGTLASLTNSGTITSYDAGTTTARAIDASANTSGFTLTQTAGTIAGTILTGSGNDAIIASGGTITSAVALGAGNNTVALSGTAVLTGAVTTGAGNDTITMADTSSYSGTLNTGSGADRLSLSGSAVFSGQIANSAANLAVTLSGGTLSLTNTGAVPLASLAISGGTLGVQINPQAGTATLINVAGATTITGATTLAATLANIGFQTGTYTVLTSGTLTGSSNLSLTTTTLPYLLTGSLNASDAAGAVSVTIARKSAAAIGLVRSEAQAYDALYAQIGSNSALSTLFLGFTDRANTLLRLRQMLPDHAGGVFDLTTSLSRLIAPGEGAQRLANAGGLSLWAQQAYSAVHQDSDNTPGYKGSGWGLSAGADYGLGVFGRLGVSIGYLFGTLTEGSTDNQVRTNVFQVGPYWTGHWGGLDLSASGAAGYLTASESRYLTSAVATTQLYSTNGHWHGLLLSAIAKGSYEAHLGPVYLRPNGSVTYFRLRENAYNETDAGAAFDLSVDRRTSTETAATGQIALGVQFGKQVLPESLVARFEVEGGRREILSSNVGATTAQFAGGNPFTIDGEDRSSGYVGTVRTTFGNDYFKFIASGTYETRNGYHDLIGRIGVRGSFF
ncbi:hypothetical protein FHS31_000476 [Sphingomonas vulcanisoli]|uniref:Autotransporter domain-containing protein n=1 Tax=Sphingomonas vulcanisoli TaxID=1658060 RepID=A0ABX0TMZ2_9SPHN|nr:autotransporter domain-containing protein [Sphingomonas vulcanisoli]NIJ06894.1 hypothetical protein [Sphingomonas vulcanisoli]